jgi:2-oxoglutarate dehydrogenase E1 component
MRRLHLLPRARRDASRRRLSQFIDTDKTEISFRMLKMIRSFRAAGHFASSLDPLSSYSGTDESARAYRLKKLAWVGRDSQDLPDVTKFMRNGAIDLSIFKLGDVNPELKYYLGDEISSQQMFWSVQELLSTLINCYCGNVGVEIMHIKDNAKRRWLLEKVETTYGPSKWNLSSAEQQKTSLARLLKGEHTAKFLGVKFSSSKIFGIEGCEALIPALWSVAEAASCLGVDAIEMGMAHRARLVVLHEFLGKSLSSICNKFNESEYNSGDVKFHLGARTQLSIPSSSGTSDSMKLLHVSLCANPSHLEAVYPVVIGKTKAKQVYVNDKTMKKVMPLILHGYSLITM